MKRILLLLALSLTVMVSAQDKLLEGIIVSKQTISSNNEQMNTQLAMMGDIQTTTYFKDGKTRSELYNPMSGDIVTISNAATKETLMLMDNPAMGKKYMLKKTEIKDKDLEKIKVIAGDKTKTVLGYICNQFIVSLNQDGTDMEMEIYTTESIPAASDQLAMLGKKLKGFPLYMTIKVNQMGSDMLITTEVTEIKRESVSNDKFNMTPPEGYENMGGQ